MDDTEQRAETRDEAQQQVRLRAVQSLSRRDYARAELRGRLQRGCTEPGIIDAVLDELSAQGLLSDTRFAESFVRHRAGQGYGPQRIRRELAQRGVDAQLIEVSLAGSDIDWRQRAEAVRVKKFGSATPADFRSRAKQAQFLRYRGFDSESIQLAFSE